MGSRNSSMGIGSQRSGGGFQLAGAVTAAILLTGLAVQHIRVGGTVQRQIDSVTGFSADILPPPIRIVEPGLAQNRDNLAELERQYRARLTRWTADDVNPRLAGKLRDLVAKEADAFWTEVNKVLLPALARSDMAIAQASEQKR